MFGKRIELFRVFGFPLRLDLSWIFIAVLLTWSLAAGLFPRLYPDLSVGAYWAMGVVGALGLFGSIVLHEASHAKVAQRYGIDMKGITLFLFGGVAEMGGEPREWKSELLVAVAGPAASIVIAGVFFGLDLGAQAAGLPVAVIGVLGYLWTINLIIVGFNLLPAFPLDGGRVLRAILWKIKGSLRRATRISARAGSFFAILLIVLGVVWFLGGNFIGGMWWFLLGLFLHGAASGSYQQVLVRRALEGEPVRKFMHVDVQQVPPDITLDRLVEDYMYRYHFKMFPVARDDRLLGCVTTKDIRDLPREEWASRTVEQVAHPCGPENTIGPETDSLRALSTMHRTGSSRLMVVDDGKLAGIVSLKDLLGFIHLKVELEEG